MATDDRVSMFLQSLELEVYEPLFRRAGLSDSDLPILTDEALKVIGITSLGHRKRILLASSAMKALPPAPAASRSARRPTQVPAQVPQPMAPAEPLPTDVATPALEGKPLHTVSGGPKNQDLKPASAELPETPSSPMKPLSLAKESAPHPVAPPSVKLPEAPPAKPISLAKEATPQPAEPAPLSKPVAPAVEHSPPRAPLDEGDLDALLAIMGPEPAADAHIAPAPEPKPVDAGPPSSTPAPRILVEPLRPQPGTVAGPDVAIVRPDRGVAERAPFMKRRGALVLGGTLALGTAGVILLTARGDSSDDSVVRALPTEPPEVAAVAVVAATDASAEPSQADIGSGAIEDVRGEEAMPDHAAAQRDASSSASDFGPSPSSRDAAQAALDHEEEEPKQDSNDRYLAEHGDEALEEDVDSSGNSLEVGNKKKNSNIRQDDNSAPTRRDFDANEKVADTFVERDITSLASASASSVLPDDLGFNFVARNLIDGDFSTSWQPSAKSREGVGEFFALSFSEPQLVNRLEIANGYQFNWQGQDLFSMNARLASVSIDLGTRVEKFTFNSGARGFVKILINPPVETKRIKVWAKSTHSGSRWPDLAVTEVKVFGLRDIYSKPNPYTK
jgi:hypothetical protein